MTTARERHFRSSNTVRDIVLGMSDGLTVPFALAAGLTGVVAGSTLVVTAGLAEIVAGSISMGLGGYLAARSDVEHYLRERKIEEQEVKDTPQVEEDEVMGILRDFGLDAEQSETIVERFRRRRQAWVDFMMQNELGLEKPNPRRSLVSAVTIGGAYAVGGLVPLFPYMIVGNAREALLPSAIVTVAALFLFGYFKAKTSGINPWRSAIQTVLVGGIAAGAAFLLAKYISQR